MFNQLGLQRRLAGCEFLVEGLQPPVVFFKHRSRSSFLDPHLRLLHVIHDTLFFRPDLSGLAVGIHRQQQVVIGERNVSVRRLFGRL